MTSLRKRFWFGLTAAVSVAAVAASLLGLSVRAPRAYADTSATSTVGFGPQFVLGSLISHNASQPPTAADCAAQTGGLITACYGPSDIWAEYDLKPLYQRGIEGQGQTIVIFDSFGSPTIQQDLKTFDQGYGLPDPPSFNIYYPEGNVVLNYANLPSPFLNHNKRFNADEFGWAIETTLDVEWAHAIAPLANIALVVTPVVESAGMQGLQNLVNAQKWVLQNHIGTIWSNSYGAFEQSFDTTSSVQTLNNWYHQAAAAGVSNFFASGDTGAAGFDKQFQFYSYPVVTYPTSSPDGIGVGGTRIPNPPPTISSYQPEVTMQDPYGAGGGGFSAVFSEPAYQVNAGISDPTGMRGVPDVSYNGDIFSPYVFYETFDPFFKGWTNIAGTSAGAPQWAAIDALANQADGNLGFLAPRLYQIYSNPAAYASSFHDITVGNNSFAGVTGYNAAPGWDAATGMGTPDVTNLVAALAATH